MSESSFVENLNNKYFGLKNYEEAVTCPLLENQIDKRFFNSDGSPNTELATRYEKLFKALEAEGVLPGKAEIYVVGGVASSSDKTNYTSDLDFYVHIPSINESMIKYDEEEDNIAGRLIKDINGVIPDEIGRKKGNFSDVMVSKFPPMGQLPYDPGEQRTVYNMSKRLWTTIKGI